MSKEGKIWIAKVIVVTLLSAVVGELIVFYYLGSYLGKGWVPTTLPAHISVMVLLWLLFLAFAARLKRDQQLEKQNNEHL